MASGGDLLLIRVPCEGAAQLLDLKNSRLVPGTQTLDRQWKEDDTLLICPTSACGQLSGHGRGSRLLETPEQLEEGLPL